MIRELKQNNIVIRTGLYRSKTEIVTLRPIIRCSNIVAPCIIEWLTGKPE